MGSGRNSVGRPDPGEVPVNELAALRIWLLGGFRISVGASRSIHTDEWRLKKAANLLKLLSLAPGHRLHRDQVAGLLWPDLDPRAASNNLHHALYVARRTLEPSSPGATSSYLLLRDERLTLCPDGSLWVDVDAFEEAAMSARHARQVAAYRAALDLYQGELLPQDRYEPWAEQRRAELRELYLSLLVELAALYEERGEHAQAIEALSRVVAEESTHEEAHVGLMRLYALSGRRGDALGQYEQLREALDREFGTEPDAASTLLQQEIWTGSFSLRTATSAEQPSARGAFPHNLPVMRTSFVGRERQTREVGRLLAMTGLLTLTGAGGSGKTRLALEVARNLVGAYPDGVWLVELASLSDPLLVPQTVARVLDVREKPGSPPQDALVQRLLTKNTLLVLDNCEHLLDQVAHLSDALLRYCPKLRILATSREPLGVRGEVLWRVPPLSLPAEEAALSVGVLSGTEAGRLFMDRALSRSSGFQLTLENAEAVGGICRKLEGMPLAIELAAARMGTLSAGQVSARLDDSLKLLTSGARTAEPRQQTLRATLDWGHELLSGAERELFARLSVFSGGWTLEAAEAVCSGQGIEATEVLDLLSRLADKSLVMVEEGAKARYRMLEPVRQYGQQRLEENGRSEKLRRRHADYYLGLAEQVEPELVGASPAEGLTLLEDEYGNLRAALSWSLDADGEQTERAEIGLRLATALGRFWDAHGPTEGRRWLERGLARSGAVSASVRARALNEAGFVAVYEGDAGAMALLEEALALYKEQDDRSGVALTMSNLGHAVLHLGRRERMRSLRVEVEALLSEPLDKRLSAHLLLFLGFASLSEADFEELESPRVEEALALFREVGDVQGITMCLPSLGMINLWRGDAERAAELFREGLLLQKELKHQQAIVFGLLGAAGVAALRGQPVRAAKLFGAAEALRVAIGLVVTPLADGYFGYEERLAETWAGLGEASFEAAHAEGRALTPEQAIQYALSDDVEQEPLAPEAGPPAGDQMDPLTPREREVALLVARGFTNRQIAENLSLSERTVENHVRRILRKLGYSSRARIASWVARQR